MHYKTVTATIMVDGKSVEIKIDITCASHTPDHELIRRAGNILRHAADSAEFKVG
jgi:hypothetical protein